MLKIFEKQRKLSIVITIIIAILIFLFSSISGTQKGVIPGTNIFSIIYHFLIFFLLTFFLLISMHGKENKNKDYILIGTITIIVYAILDELHQAFVPFRFPSVGDVLIDSLGIFAAVGIYIYIKKN